MSTWTGRARGWPVPGYRLSDHPLQQELLQEVAAFADVDSESIPTAIDGCGVVCFAIPLERAASAFARAAETRIAAAMRARPELVGGEGATDTELMRALCLRATGKCEYFDFIEGDATYAIFETKRVGRPPQREKYTIEQQE